MTAMESRLWSAAVVFVVLGVLVAGVAEGFGTGSYLSDEERAVTVMSAAPTFSVTALLGADHLLDVKGSKPGDTTVLDGGTTWRLDETTSDTVTLSIAAETEAPLTFAVDRKSLLRVVGAKSFDSVTLSYGDGSIIAATGRTVDGTEWIVFTVDRFPDAQIHIETVPGAERFVTAATESNSSNETIGAVSNGSMTPVTNSSVDPGTNDSVDPATNETLLGPSLEPMANQTVDPETNGSGGNSTAEPVANATDEETNTTAPSSETTADTTGNETALPTDPVQIDGSEDDTIGSTVDETNSTVDGTENSETNDNETTDDGSGDNETADDGSGDGESSDDGSGDGETTSGATTDGESSDG